MRFVRFTARLAVAALLAAPEKTDRAIADEVSKQTGERVHHETVGAVRKQLAESEEIRQLPRTTGKDGAPGSVDNFRWKLSTGSVRSGAKASVLNLSTIASP